MKKAWWILIVVVVFIGGAIYYFTLAPGKLDAFAQCLENNGAKFYGTFWCPFCQKQKAMFGRSARLLPYVECSTRDGRGQLPVCRDKNIESYPTWEFADGTRETGLTQLDFLAEKTGCPLV